MQRFWNKVKQTDTCWEWIAARFSDGYGMFQFYGRATKAHRFAYELLVGPIPKGLVCHHLCRNRACVNPSHLIVTTNRENTLQGNGPTAIAARQTRCPQNHSYGGANLRITSNGARRCRTCARNESYHRYWRKRLSALPRRS